MEQGGNSLQSVDGHQVSDLSSHASVSDAEQISAALAQLKDPPQAEALVGTVVGAGQAPGGQTVVAVDTSSEISTVRPAITPPALRFPADSTKRAKGSLGEADLKQLAQLLTTPKPAGLKTGQAAHVIMPNAPEADAAIPRAAAEVAYEAQLARQAEEAKHIKAHPAQFVEPIFNMRLFYLYGSIWLGAIPSAMVLYLLSGKIPGARNPGVVDFIFTVCEYMLGAYGLVGWVTLVVLYKKSTRGGL